MINKTILIFGLISFISLSKTFSQGIMFDYDENGNRKLRNVIELPYVNKNLAQTDSISGTNDTLTAELKTIEASFAGNKVMIYPNPAKYDIIVEIENISDKKAEINVYDVFGKSVENIQVIANRTLIDFSQRAIGAYLLKMTIDNKSETWKIIKE